MTSDGSTRPEVIVRTTFDDDRPDLVERVPADRAEAWAAATRADLPSATVTIEPLKL